MVRGVGALYLGPVPLKRASLSLETVMPGIILQTSAGESHSDDAISDTPVRWIESDSI